MRRAGGCDAGGRSRRPGGILMHRRMPVLALTIFCQLAAAAALAGPMTREQVPEPLRPWIDWVLRGHEDAFCPSSSAPESERQCTWPAQLSLALDDDGG